MIYAHTSNMDVVWLILDSLSFEATPFSPRGPDTMPELKRAADLEGSVFTRAYAPGPSSPSSHASFFTGELPSVAGMHEAVPRFDGRVRTIADALNDTHRTLVVSANPFIFNGLSDSFDFSDDLRSRQYMLFEGGSDPGKELPRIDAGSSLEKYLRFVFQDGKPVRSLLNGVRYKLWWMRHDVAIPRHSPDDERTYQYANTMNERIRSFIDEDSSDAFVVANYMDVHPPLDPSTEALNRFLPDKTRDELPVGVRGQEIHERVKGGDGEIGELMYGVYQASIWDLDRKISPLIEDLLDQDTFVVITADHGHWFKRGRELDEERLHVPLVMFVPGREPETVTKTVNLRSLPRTTMEVVSGSDGGFGGRSLLDVEDHHESVTEFIHDTSPGSSPVSPYGESEEGIQYDLAVVKGDVRVDYVDGEYVYVRGDRGTDGVRELETLIKELKSENIEVDEDGVDYDAETQQRLEDLGYL